MLEYIPTRQVHRRLTEGWEMVSKTPGDYAALMAPPKGWEQVSRDSDAMSCLYRNDAGKLMRLDGRRTHGAPKVKHEKCTLAGCDGQHWARGFCQKHYKRFRATGHPQFICKPGPKAHGECDFPKCRRKSTALGLCNRHYLRYRAAERRANELLEAA
jgi:hypothetical protein